MKITIAIPNFNGEKLLEKNLPNILESGADEILVIDDASKDNSLEVLEKWKEKNENLKVIIHKKNQGFTSSVNELFEEAKGDIVISLNNDVWVEKDFLKPLEKHFENDQVFAVNLHEEGEGPSVAFWKDGYFEFRRGKELKIIQKSAWASGGSAAFRKNIWKDLGGLDKILAPFYWEDVDISFRALKKGFEILWEPEAKVKHEHGTTIEKTHKKRYTNWIKERNQLLFIWNNIHDKNLKRDHKKALLKRLLTMGFGYWIVFTWALVRNVRFHREELDKNSRTDLEAINYAESPTVSVIIVSFNSEDFIEKCISLVLKHTIGELIVLDNNSTDSTVKKLEKFGKSIKLIKSSENLGFGKGNNKASLEATGDYLFFLNPDTELENSLEELVNFYENTPDVGIVAPKLITPNGAVQESVKKLPSVMGAFKEYILGLNHAYSQYAPDVNEPIQVEMAYGAAWLVKKDLFNSLEGFNEKFFLYYEDADFCKKVKNIGKKIYYYPKFSVKHLVGATKTSQNKYQLNLESSKKYHGLVRAFLLRLIFFISRLLQKS